MSTLTFFPWLTLRAPVSTSAFELIPYSRGQRPGGAGSALQATLDAVLDPYRTSPSAPAPDATLLRMADRELTADVTADEAEMLLRWGELVAFAGLASRRFFDSLGYSNRDAFRVVVQRFDDPTRGIAVVSRRRDGSAWTAVTRGALIVVKPYHVSSAHWRQPDATFLEALLQRSARPNWGEIEEGIVGFNSANTDSPDMRQETEAVAMVGAFERVLGLRGGDEHELATAFEKLLRPSQSIAPADCALVQQSTQRTRYERYPTLRSAWIRDLFRLRGDHAHGKIAPAYRPLWSLEEHLLLGAFAFPLVVKLRLADDGDHSLTDEDCGGIEAFERLISVRHLEERPPEDQHTYPWNRILRSALLCAQIDRWVASRPPAAAEGAEPDLDGGRALADEV